jgi:hypothetical protein
MKKDYELYITKLKKAREYKKEIEKVYIQYQIDEKKQYIKETEKFIKDIDFFIMLGSHIGEIYNYSHKVKMEDEFLKQMDLFKVEIEREYFVFDGVELYDDRCWYYKNSYHDYIEDQEDIGTIPYDIDLFGLIDYLEEFEKICDEKYKEIEAEKQRLAEIQKQQKEAEEYSLYLKLKEKYEKA